MTQYIKDPSHPLGWRTVSYPSNTTRRGVSSDDSMVNADGMVEEPDEGMEDVEPDEPVNRS